MQTITVIIISSVRVLKSHGFEFILMPPWFFNHDIGFLKKDIISINSKWCQYSSYFLSFVKLLPRQIVRNIRHIQLVTFVYSSSVSRLDDIDSPYMYILSDKLNGNYYQ